MTSKNGNFLITGIGGQGTVLASRVIAQVFMNRGMGVRTAETIGMSQRGGTVSSHVRCAQTTDDIFSSLIPKGTADLIVAFEPGEALRMLDYLAPNGRMVCATTSRPSVTDASKRHRYDGEKQLEYLRSTVQGFIGVDDQKLVAQLGNPRALNTILLGVAFGDGFMGVSPKDVKEAIDCRVKPSFIELNHKAYDLGANYCTVL